MVSLDWDAVSIYKQQLTRLGFVDVKTTKMGTKTIVFDFHVPAKHPAVERRGIASSLQLKAPVDYKMFNLRFPTVYPDRVQFAQTALITGAIENVMDNPERERGAGAIQYRGHVELFDETVTFTVETATAERGGVNIHIVHREDEKEDAREFAPDSAIRVMSALVEGFYNQLQTEPLR